MFVYVNLDADSSFAIEQILAIHKFWKEIVTTLS